MDRKNFSNLSNPNFEMQLGEDVFVLRKAGFRLRDKFDNDTLIKMTKSDLSAFMQIIHGCLVEGDQEKLDNHIKKMPLGDIDRFLRFFVENFSDGQMKVDDLMSTH